MMVGLKARMSPMQFRTELSVRVFTFAKPMGIPTYWKSSVQKLDWSDRGKREGGKGDLREE